MALPPPRRLQILNGLPQQLKTTQHYPENVFFDKDLSYNLCRTRIRMNRKTIVRRGGAEVDGQMVTVWWFSGRTKKIARPSPSLPPRYFYICQVTGGKSAMTAEISLAVIELL